MASGPWSDDEIRGRSDIYFRMLTLELAGEAYSKAEFRRQLAQEVARSPAALDYKFDNVLGSSDQLGAVWIPGYKPLRNIQGRLREMVHERFSGESDLRAFMLRAVEDESPLSGGLGPETEPPRVDWPQARRLRRAVLGIDYAAIEASNSKLGNAGEESVLSSERERLVRGGRADLAARVRHVAQLDGDGLGYDIRSFHGLTDEPTYLEVKTTKYDKEIPSTSRAAGWKHPKSTERYFAHFGCIVSGARTQVTMCSPAHCPRTLN